MSALETDWQAAIVGHLFPPFKRPGDHFVFSQFDRLIGRFIENSEILECKFYIISMVKPMKVLFIFEDLHQILKITLYSENPQIRPYIFLY